MNRLLACTAEFLSTWAGFLLNNALIVLAWFLVGSDDEPPFTLFLSILAIELTLIVLVGQHRGERAVQEKLDALVRADPDVPDEVAGIEWRNG